MTIRMEKDSLGSIEVPITALWGAQTQRALLNFPISQWPMPQSFIETMGLLKSCAAKANLDLKLISQEKAEVIIKIGEEIAKGVHLEHFPLDVFQTGSCTSSNMNVNEVIVGLAEKIYKIQLHPNDDVNMSQSSNDFIPSVIHAATVISGFKLLLPAIDQLLLSLQRRKKELQNVVKTGRTHLMDALPLTFGQEISGWIAQISFAKDSLTTQLRCCQQLAIGGTAVGTGLNALPEFSGNLIGHLNAKTGLSFEVGENFFELLSSQDRIVACSGALKTLAVALTKIASDLRWMNSGPCAGLGEIRLPSVQPGSSIMPGKVNPVIVESCLMVCAHVIGTDLTISLAGQSGNFQLNVMLPIIAYHLLENIRILANTCSNLAAKAIDGFEVCVDSIEALLSKNPIVITALNRKIGYERGAIIAKKALAENRPVIDVALEETSLSRKELEEILDPYHLTQGGLN